MWRTLDGSAAVTQLTRNPRASLGPRGVRVRSVAPAFAVTGLGADMAHEATRVGLDEMRPGKAAKGWISRTPRT
ncbi:hypothetical protein OG985_43385 [Streptomyces sp. NBC_00289]|uniref:hypothetical protein n=1 Tax=Streptomyces sp. NBC_00289 TaxID=2975703 RepID=UPI0032484577